MEKILRLKELNVLPHEPQAAEIYTHWSTMFEGFVQASSDARPAAEERQLINKHRVLINHVSPHVYTFIADLPTYDEVKTKLDRLCKKRTNDVYAQHVLATRKQKSEEMLLAFIQVLETPAKNCLFVATNAATYKQHMLRDALINGTASTSKTLRKR